MFAEHFKITGFAVLEIFLLALAGFSLTKKQFLSSQGLDDLSRLVMDVTLPLLIFSQLIRDFSFSLYHNWWIFPLKHCHHIYRAAGRGGFRRAYQGRAREASVFKPGFIPKLRIPAACPGRGHAFRRAKG